MDLTEELKSHAKKIDELLANIKVCDPAVGSGAFPLGLLNEIVKARVKIGEYINSEYSIYDLKLHAISNSIYGVDFDPGAVEIAKLRFWLSLVVEEDTPSPLPNLDHKIMQGNSLISEYEGIKLFDDDILIDIESRFAEIDQLENTINSIQQQYFLLHSKGEYTNTSKFELQEKIKPLNNKIKSLKRQNTQEVESSGLFDRENVNKQIAQNTARALNAKKAELISTHSQSNKERLKKEIEELSWRLIEITLQERGELDKLEKIKELRRERSKPFFIWKLEFGEVFKKNGGFDVIIANPPYINTREIRHEPWRVDLEREYGWVDDLYNHFTELAFRLTKNNGIISFITSDTFLTLQSKANMRDKLLNNEIIHIIQTPKAFSAMVNTAIYIVKNNNKIDNYPFDYSDIRKPNYEKLGFSEDYVNSSGKGVINWEKILAPLFGGSFKDYIKNIDIDLFRENLNQTFFSPTKMNLQIRDKLIPGVKKLYDSYWELVKTSRDISNNIMLLNEYRDSLKPNDLTLLGLVTEGGQGMATGNNGRFVGCLKGTKSANRILVTRAQKLFEAFSKNNKLYDAYHLFSNCTNKNNFDDILSGMDELEIRELFDEIKMKNSRDIFVKDIFLELLTHLKLPI